MVALLDMSTTRAHPRCDETGETNMEQLGEWPWEAPLGQLERALIKEFLRGRGHDSERVALLPQAERDALLRQASIHASTRLCEIESRSHYLHDLHDGIPRAS